MALRLAIGAGRARLIRQLLTETVLLFVLGGTAGLLLARWMTSVLVSRLPTLPFPVVALAHPRRPRGRLYSGALAAGGAAVRTGASAPGIESGRDVGLEKRGASHRPPASATCLRHRPGDIQHRPHHRRGPVRPRASAGRLNRSGFRSARGRADVDRSGAGPPHQRDRAAVRSRADRPRAPAAGGRNRDDRQRPAGRIRGEA